MHAKEAISPIVSIISIRVLYVLHRTAKASLSDGHGFSNPQDAGRYPGDDAMPARAAASTAPVGSDRALSSRSAASAACESNNLHPAHAGRLDPKSIGNECLHINHCFLRRYSGLTVGPGTRGAFRVGHLENRPFRVQIAFHKRNLIDIMGTGID